MKSKSKGLLIVIDGSDGSGKATQTRILVRKLAKMGYKTETFSFPDYDTRYGKRIAAFLRGEYGSIDEVSPYMVAKMFADDRKLHRKTIVSALNQGKVVVLDRYVSSNLHEAAKIKSKKGKDGFIRWFYDMEYKNNRMPREDLTFYLYVPVPIAQKLIFRKKKRPYMKGGKADIHEEDIKFQKAVKKTYFEEIKKSKNWKKVDCAKKGKILTRKQINDKIFKIIEPSLKRVVSKN